MSPAPRISTQAILAILTITALPVVPAFAAPGAWSALGPDGGAAFSLAVDPDDPSIVYAGSDAGIYKSTDDGDTWELASRGLSLGATIGQDTVAPGKLYTVSGTGIFQSGDDAQNWTRTEGNVPEPVRDLAVDPKSPGRLWVVTSSSRLYFSTNGGRSWSKRQGSGINALMIGPAGDWLYANTASQGFLRSSDLGISWRAVLGIPKTSAVSDLAFDPADASTVYAAAADGLYRSRDKGASWQKITAAVLAGKVSQVEFQGSRILAANKSGIFYSSDGGTTWTFGGGPPQSRGEVIALAASPDTAFAGTWQPYELGSVFRSLDRGASWQLAQQGFAAVSINALDASPSNPDILYALAGWTDVYRSLNRGATWELLNLGTLPGANLYLTDILFDPANAANTYITDLATSRLLRSVDSGKTYSAVQIFAAPTRIALDPRSAGALWGLGSQGVHHSGDRGNTWSKVGPKITQTHVFTDLDVDPWDPKVLWAVGSAQASRQKLQPRVYRSGDGGVTWERRDTGLGGKTVLSLALDATAPSTTLYAGTDKGLYRSADAGRTWKLLPGISGEITQVMSASSGLYAFASGIGLSRSTNQGQNWTPARTGLGALPILDLAIDPANPRHFYAGTFGRGVFDYTEP
jgi:photosystem II stability/assembly factor-like uncharacterized protein